MSSFLLNFWNYNYKCQLVINPWKMIKLKTKKNRSISVDRTVYIYKNIYVLTFCGFTWPSLMYNPTPRAEYRFTLEIHTLRYVIPVSQNHIRVGIQGIMWVATVWSGTACPHWLQFAHRLVARCQPSLNLCTFPLHIPYYLASRLAQVRLPTLWLSKVSLPTFGMGWWVWWR